MALQHIENPAKRRRIDTSVDDHARPVHQHDLDPA
jgi:hypothetical protein